MKIADATFAAIDFESAGARKGGTDVPVQVGIAVMHGTQIDEDSLFCSYLASDQPITWSARKVHGISDSDIADAPKLMSLWPTLKESLGGNYVVAHGSGTEKRFLRAFPFHRFGPWVDTLKIAHAALPSADGHSLENLVGFLSTKSQHELRSLCPDRKWHDALFDSVASLILLRDILTECELEDKLANILVDPDRSEYFARRTERSHESDA